MKLKKKKIKQLNLNKNIFVIPIFISDTFLKKNKKYPSFRNKIGLTEKDFIILFLGRINFKKGLDLLIPAFKKVNEKFPKTKLIMVGANSEGYLEKIINPLIYKYKVKDQVLYNKPIYGEKLIACYKDSDLFVLPSYSENFGLTIFEAMSQKLPVVVSNQVDLAPVIKKNKIARICKCTVNSVDKTIQSAIINKEKSLFMSNKAYKFVNKNYTSFKIVKEIKKKYKEIIKRNDKFSS